MPADSKDVDRGWAWMVLLAAACGQILTGMFVASTGLLQAAFLAHFDSSNAFISLVSSVFVSLQLLMGPVSGFFCNLFGLRVTTVLGGLMFSLGAVAGSFAASVHHLLIAYGALAGAGFGMAYVPVNVVLGHYFHKKRALANGLAIGSCGLGVGAGPFLTTWLLETHGWRYALYITGALGLQFCVIGAIFYQPPTFKRKSLKLTRLKCPQRTSLTWFLGHPHWWVLCGSYGLQMMGCSIQIIHFPSYMVSMGMQLRDYAPLETAFGIALSVSRILGGCFCNDEGVDLLTVMCSTTCIYGLLIMSMPLYPATFTSMMFYQVFMSLFYGVAFVPVTPLTVKLFGMKHLATVFGWMMMFGGIGNLVGPIIAGRIVDITSSYTIGFYTGGAVIIFSGLMCFLIPIIKITDRNDQELCDDKLGLPIRDSRRVEEVLITTELEPPGNSFEKDKIILSNDNWDANDQLSSTSAEQTDYLIETKHDEPTNSGVSHELVN